MGLPPTPTSMESGPVCSDEKQTRTSPEGDMLRAASIRPPAGTRRTATSTYSCRSEPSVTQFPNLSRSSTEKVANRPATPECSPVP
eukprot:CAMPEP_0113265098 /NCGR_PEP_ID=MMETSP0008_2-20120614/19321_1 /TAXON_ID=97485 /ORGANISM="Prymnesium parvum" /LENGTH=85 /DNA_ID=CAMNT_0000113895 /DNA_START=895 /DNA_END=1152 /DNA_ORIENTATION=+ /assembly_acc=CAM_ASM_000153